jgi:hypothetical protein
MRDPFMSRCGADCCTCEHRAKDGCPGCSVANGKLFWGECTLFTCCVAKALDHCGQCPEFPCAALTRDSADTIPFLEAWNEKGYDAWRGEQHAQ